MSNPLSRIATRVAYGASQLPRIAWYVGHNLAMYRLEENAQRRDGRAARQRTRINAPLPDRKRLYADMAVLLRQDLANVEAASTHFRRIMTDRFLRCSTALGSSLTICQKFIGAANAVGIAKS